MASLTIPAPDATNGTYAASRPSNRREWVKARYTPTMHVRVTVSLLEGNCSVSWTVKRFLGEPLKPAVEEARARAEKALVELQEATQGGAEHG